MSAEKSDVVMFTLIDLEYDFQHNVFLIMNAAVNQGGKMERGSRVGGNSKSGRLPLIS